MMLRASVPLRIAIAIFGGLGVLLPIVLGVPSLSLLGLAVVVALALALRSVDRPGLFRLAAHAVYLGGLLATAWAVFGLGLSPVLTVYFPAIVLLGCAQILGARAALCWSVPSMALVVAGAFWPPEVEREVTPVVQFGVRAATLLMIFGFALSFRRSQDRQAAELERRATTDPLTGLANRRALDRALADVLARARRFPRRGALVYLDLDGLKPANDRFGHEAGDELIRVTGERIRQITRAADTPARVGGDEFVVLLSELADGKGAEIFARKLAAALREPVRVAAGAIEATASIGIAHFADGAADSDSLLRAADGAMYAAKQAGGDRIFACGPDGSPREVV